MGAAHTQTTQQIRREGKIRALCTERRGQRSLEDSVTEALWQTEEEDEDFFPNRKGKRRAGPAVLQPWAPTRPASAAKMKPPPSPGLTLLPPCLIKLDHRAH